MMLASLSPFQATLIKTGGGKKHSGATHAGLLPPVPLPTSPTTSFPPVGQVTPPHRHEVVAEGSDGPSAIPHPQEGFIGTASWYATGTRTANGDHFNPNALTAAHLTLPFGTRLFVRHGNKQITVTVTDRGPAKWTGHVLDLSRGAFSQLANLGRGVIRVEWGVLGN
jgi:rare lipoprotein A